MRNPFDPNYASRQGMLSKDFNEGMGWDYKERIRQLPGFQDPRRNKINDRQIMRHYLKVNTYEIWYHESKKKEDTLITINE